MKSCLDYDDENQPLYFHDDFESNASAQLHNTIPFVQIDRLNEASSRSFEPSFEESKATINEGGSSFFKDSRIQYSAKAGLGFVTPTGRLDSYVDNDSACSV